MIWRAALLVLLASPAMGHGTLPGGGGFYSGALHPLVALDHLLALLSLGLVLGMAGMRAPLTGLLATLIAGLASGSPVPLAQPVLLAATLACGAVMMSRRPVPSVVIWALCLLVGLVLGGDTDLPPDGGIAAPLGTLVAAGLIVLNAMALSAILQRWPLTLQVAGSWLVAISLMVLALSARSAEAHETTRSYLTISRAGDALKADLRIAFRDIEVVVWVDETLDGTVTWAEAERRLPVVAEYVTGALTVTAGGPCRMTLANGGASADGGIDYLDLSFDLLCPDPAAPVQVSSRLFADVDPDHRMYVSTPDGASTILGASEPTRLPAAGPDPAASGLWSTFRTYFAAGIGHLLGGPDHIVFLMLLILPAVTGAMAPRKAVGDILLAVTGFTLAHALSLTAASTQFLRPPTDLISGLIALSILLTAADNLRPFLPGPRAAAAAFFGLIHGYGFATVLAGTNLSGLPFATALAAFNLGIETAQILVVLLTGFALHALRGGRVLLTAGSGAGALAGLYWLQASLA